MFSIFESSSELSSKEGIDVSNLLIYSTRSWTSFAITSSTAGSWTLSVITFSITSSSLSVEMPSIIGSSWISS